MSPVRARALLVAVAMVAAVLAMPAGATAQQGHPKDQAIRSAMVQAFANAGVPSNPPVSLDSSNAPTLYSYWLDGGVDQKCDGYQWAAIEVHAATVPVDYSNRTQSWTSSLGGRPADRSYSQQSWECEVSETETLTVVGYDEEVTFIVGDRIEVRVIHRTTGVPTGTRLASAMLSAAIGVGLEDREEPLPFTLRATASGYAEGFVEFENELASAAITVNGTVRDRSTGLPIAGAVIDVVDGHASPASTTSSDTGVFSLTIAIDDPAARGSATTNADFTLQPETSGLSLEVAAAGYDVAVDQLLDGTEVAGTGAVVVSGIVRDSDTGDPVEGAQVRLVGLSPSAASTSDAAGVFSVATNLGGATPVTIEGWDVYLVPLPPIDIFVAAGADGYTGVFQTVQAQASWGQVEISGFVTDAATGDPIGGAVVESTGPQSAATITDVAGAYTLVVGVTAGRSDVGDVALDLALEPAPLGSIKVSFEPDMVLADGLTTSTVSITVTGPTGDPLGNRTVRLTAPDGGTLSPTEVITGLDGTATTVFTSFKPTPRPAASHSDALVDVLVKATEVVDGITGSGLITLQQHLVTVVFDREHLPACDLCSLFAGVSLHGSRYDLTPLGSVDLTVRLAAGDQGELFESPTSTSGSRELTVTTNGGGNANVWYRWNGSNYVGDEPVTIIVFEGETNGAGSDLLHVEGFDLAIAGVRPVARPSEVTFDQVYLKIYIRDTVHPDRSFSRFNAGELPVGLRLSTWQHASEGPLTSSGFDGPVRLAADSRGDYVELFITPRLPHVTTVNDGKTIFGIKIDAIDSQGFLVGDRFLPNNDSTLLVNTTSPKGVVTTWLEAGILTPHNYPLAAAKCVIRFLPGWGTAVDVVDTANALLISDWFNAGRSGVVNVSDQVLDLLTKRLPKDAAAALKSPVGVVNNVASCLEDFHRISKEGGGFSPFSAMRGRSVTYQVTDTDRAQMQWILERYVHGVMSELPGFRAVVVTGATTGVEMLDEAGMPVGSELASRLGDVALFMVPVDGDYQLEIGGSTGVHVAVFDAGDDGHRVTTTYSTGDSAAAALSLGPGTLGDLEVATVGGGVISIEPSVTSLDVVAPSLTSAKPAADSAIAGAGCRIAVGYEDEANGSGIDPTTARLLVDGIEVEGLDATDTRLRAPCTDATDGEHVVVVMVSDHDGNAAAVRWSFTIGSGEEAMAGLLGSGGDGSSGAAMGLMALAAVLAMLGAAALVKGVMGARGNWLTVAVVAMLVGGGLGGAAVAAGNGDAAGGVPVSEPGVPLAADVAPTEIVPLPPVDAPPESSTTTSVSQPSTTSSTSTSTSSSSTSSSLPAPAGTACSNGFFGYDVVAPPGWYVYELGDPVYTTDPADACTIFAPVPIFTADDALTNGQVFLMVFDEAQDPASWFGPDGWGVVDAGTLVVDSITVPWRSAESLVFPDLHSWVAFLPTTPPMQVEASAPVGQFAAARVAAEAMVASLKVSGPTPGSAELSTCVSGELGYSIGYPATWAHHDEAPVECRFFDPYEIIPDSLELSAIAIYPAPEPFADIVDLLRTFAGQTIRSDRDLTVGGFAAVAVERDFIDADGITMRLFTVVIDFADTSLARPAIILEATGRPGDPMYAAARRYLEEMLATFAPSG